MDFLHRIAEERIRAAIEAGQLDDLPGAGKPLALEDLSRVPADLRLGYTVLKNAGLLPEEMELRKEMLTLRDLLACCRDDAERAEHRRRLGEKTLRFEMLMERRRGNAALREYAPKILGRLGR